MDIVNHKRTDLQTHSQTVTYNLFARKDAPELYCAIPEDRPVPDFIDCDWRFKGSLDRSQRAPGGFIPPSTAESARARKSIESDFPIIAVSISVVTTMNQFTAALGIPDRDSKRKGAAVSLVRLGYIPPGPNCIELHLCPVN